MALDGRPGDDAPRRDRRIREAVDAEREHLALAWREFGERRGGRLDRVGAGGEVLDQRRVIDGD